MKLEIEYKKLCRCYIDKRKYLMDKIDRAEFWEEQSYRAVFHFCSIDLNQEWQVGPLLLVL